MESGGQFERELPPTNVFYEELETSVEAESNANVECESASSMLQTLKRWRDSQPEEDRRLFDLRFRSGIMYIRDRARRRRTLDRTWGDYNVNTGSPYSQRRNEEAVDDSELYVLPEENDRYVWCIPSMRNGNNIQGLS